MGFLGPVPEREILYETIRNLYFHVPMWFTMTAMFITSLVYSIKYLNTKQESYDVWAVEFANGGILFGFLGLTTGMIWAQFTWGAWWSFDPKQNGAAVTLLIYLAYMVLRNSITDSKSRAKVSAVYNIYAFAAMVPLIFILPRLTDSLHPGAEGNPAFSGYDLDGTMRLVFYPAVIGWIMLGVWIVSLRVRIRNIKDKMYESSL
ncbi:ABC transporter permease [bacterium]|nr:ABC transporter permease [bacterium]